MPYHDVPVVSTGKKFIKKISSHDIWRPDRNWPDKNCENVEISDRGSCTFMLQKSFFTSRVLVPVRRYYDHYLNREDHGWISGRVDTRPNGTEVTRGKSQIVA